MTKNQMLQQLNSVLNDKYGITSRYSISLDYSHYKTQNYWITTEVNSLPAGINAETEDKWIVIGYEDGWYLFFIKHLKEIQQNHEWRYSKKNNSKGFLLNKEEMEDNCVAMFKIKAKKPQTV